MGVSLCIFGSDYQALGAKVKSQFFDLIFYWKPGCSKVFRGFDWLSSISGSKVMAEKRRKIWGNPQKSLWG